MNTTSPSTIRSTIGILIVICLVKAFNAGQWVYYSMIGLIRYRRNLELVAETLIDIGFCALFIFTAVNLYRRKRSGWIAAVALAVYHATYWLVYAFYKQFKQVDEGNLFIFMNIRTPSTLQCLFYCALAALIGYLLYRKEIRDYLDVGSISFWNVAGWSLLPSVLIIYFVQIRYWL